uniref:AKAP7_NLS domain-containing protein n=1 Tax=Steinernema glaseri TaxID=37863 RepID=A0A1I7XW36_9BILA
MFALLDSVPRLAMQRMYLSPAKIQRSRFHLTLFVLFGSEAEKRCGKMEGDGPSERRRKCVGVDVIRWNGLRKQVMQLMSNDWEGGSYAVEVSVLPSLVEYKNNLGSRGCSFAEGPGMALEKETHGNPITLLMLLGRMAWPTSLLGEARNRREEDGSPICIHSYLSTSFFGSSLAQVTRTFGLVIEGSRQLVKVIEASLCTLHKTEDSNLQEYIGSGHKSAWISIGCLSGGVKDFGNGGF